MSVNVKAISTEQRNKDTIKIDKVSTIKMVQMINEQDKQVALAVETQLKQIAKAIDLCAKAIASGGRVIYFGAGTSGRLGVLDASEILPTYGEANWFVGIIAGGDKALRTPIENAEDNKEFILNDLKELKVTKKDVLVGLAASGRTPYVVAGLQYGQKSGISTISITTSAKAEVSKYANVAIEAVTGPETITGSTRMKSGSAQKMILNMISTGVAVKMGKTYSNYMVDMKPTNEKLVSRAINMIINVTAIPFEEAEKVFYKSGQNVKTAIVMTKLGLSKTEAQARLKIASGKLSEII